MGSSMFYVIAILIVFLLVLYIMLQTTSERLKIARMKIEEYEYNFKQMNNENSALKEELKLNAKLEKETNEKITAIANGDLSPDDVLPKQ